MYRTEVYEKLRFNCDGDGNPIGRDIELPEVEGRYGIAFNTSNIDELPVLGGHMIDNGEEYRFKINPDGQIIFTENIPQGKTNLITSLEVSAEKPQYSDQKLEELI